MSVIIRTVKQVLRALAVAAVCYCLALAVSYFAGAFAIKRHHIESGLYILTAIWLLHLFLLPASEAGDSGSASALWLVPVVPMAVCLLYWRAAQLGLLSDDYVLRSWARAGNLWGVGSWFTRPVPLGIWQGLFTLGAGATALHVLNVGLHALNAVLAATVAAQLGLRRVGILITTAVFVWWPTQVEPVLWASGIFDVLVATWMLTAILVCLRWRRHAHRPLDLVVVAVLGGLALFTKESAIALPFLLVILMAPHFRRPWLPSLLPVLVSLACGAGYLIWRLVEKFPIIGTPALTRYVLKEQVSRTFGTLAIPFSESVLHAYPYIPIWFALALAVLVFATVAGTRRAAGHTIAIQGLLWCLVAAAPTIGYLLIGPDFEGSRYLYLPALGWGLFLGGLYQAAGEASGGIWKGVAGVLIASMCGIALVQQRAAVSHWVSAASERDRILAAGRRVDARGQCRSLVFEGLPGTHRGAPLFGNGFAEALSDAGARTGGDLECRFAWNGTEFVKR
jgi:hypothetical protein